MDQKNEFAEILKSVMETEVPPENVQSKSIDYLVQEGFIDEHGNRKFHVTEKGSFLYAELVLKKLRDGK